MLDDSKLEGTPEEPGATGAEQLVRMLWDLGVRFTFGICGREIIPLWSALQASQATDRPIVTIHARRESGAGYAAIGSWAQTGRPAGLFTTTGPGITNAITALETARAAGAKLVLVTPLTPIEHRHQLAIQETGFSGFVNRDVHLKGRLFDLVEQIESPSQLQPLAGRLANGFAAPGAFLAHIAIPATLQQVAIDLAPVVPSRRRSAAALDPESADDIVELLADNRFVVWVGHGARHDAPAIRRLLDLTGAPVMSTPRGLGIADRHPQFIGTTGNAGRRSTVDAFVAYAPQLILVLGTAMDEASSGWMAELVAPDGFIHVDIDAEKFGRAYPQAATFGVQAEVRTVLDAILARSARLVRREPVALRSMPPRLTLVPADPRAIHPATAMDAIQRIIVAATQIPVLADAASSMFWATRHLVFDEPGRWFVENAWGAVGNAAGAVVGFAVGRGGPALAIVGDHAMHTEEEINTAVAYGIPAIWLVINDGSMGIVRHGMRKDGWPRADTDFPPTDFVAIAVAKGARGRRVTREEDLDDALLEAINADGPFVLDVVVDREAVAPIGARTGKR